MKNKDTRLIWETYLNEKSCPPGHFWCPIDKKCVEDKETVEEEKEDHRGHGHDCEEVHPGITHDEWKEQLNDDTVEENSDVIAEGPGPRLSKQERKDLQHKLPWHSKGPAKRPVVGYGEKLSDAEKEELMSRGPGPSNRPSTPKNTGATIPEPAKGKHLVNPRGFRNVLDYFKVNKEGTVKEGMGQPDDFTGAEPDHLPDEGVVNDGSQRNDFWRMKVAKAVEDVDNEDFLRKVIETIWVMREQEGITGPEEIGHDFSDDETHDEPRGPSAEDMWGGPDTGPGT